MGKYALAEETFKKAITKFPSNKALKVFYAMVLYNLNEHSEAMELLLQLLATTSNDKDINEYARALDYYSDKLDQTW